MPSPAMVRAATASGILSSASYLPAREVSNEEVAGWCDVTPAWISARTGVEGRRYAGADEPTSALAAQALRTALGRSGLRVTDLSAIIVCTSTPDQPQPPTAAFVLRALGGSGSAAFDVNGVCVGFLYGLAAAQSWRTRGPVAVIGADKYSTIMDRRDRRTVSLFGDGAGAVILSALGHGDPPLEVVARCQPEHVDLVRVRAGGSALPSPRPGDATAAKFEMQGRAVLEWAASALPPVVQQACQEAGVALQDVDRVVLHQGSRRLVEQCARWLHLPISRFALTADRFGNTGAASLPLTLAEEDVAGRLVRGRPVLLAGLGGGTTACATVIRW